MLLLKKKLQARQGAHLVKNQLKKAIEEANGEKALRQVTESTLQEKTWEVAQVEKKLVTTERDQDSAN